MNKLYLLLLFFGFAACSADRDPAPKPVVNAPKPAADDCDFTTELVPGIPGSPGNLIRSPRNPNGDSELADLMRTFIDDLEAAKSALAAGQTPKKLYPTHRKMRCAWHTVPSDRNKAFDDRAKSHLSVVRTFDEKPGRDTYNAIVQSCISCHSVSCQGPIPFLTRMQWQ